jgi:hypothetical protein
MVLFGIEQINDLRTDKYLWPFSVLVILELQHGLSWKTMGNTRRSRFYGRVSGRTLVRTLFHFAVVYIIGRKCIIFISYLFNGLIPHFRPGLMATYRVHS